LVCSGGWDVHTHIVPPAVVAAGERGAFAMRADAGKLTICGHGVPLHPISDAAKLVERVESDRLDGAIVSVPPPLFRPDLALGERVGYARLVNDGLFDACQRHARRLRPLAYLPVEDPEAALTVLDTIGPEWAGVVMGTDTGVLSYASDRLNPLWAALSQRGLTLFIHPGSTPDQRLEPFYLSNLLGNPVETTIAAANIIFSGVLHRFPDLKIVLAHGGGCLIALYGRWQRGMTTKRPDVPALDLPPEAAIRRFYVDSILHSAPVLNALVSVLGDDRILLGSDWPFPMGAPSADYDLGHFDESLRMKIRKNAESAFGARLKVGG
jgi:aminocarboxymuconate-semialdehyde decarboxylase